MSEDLEALRARIAQAKAAREQLREKVEPLNEAEQLKLDAEAEEQALEDDEAIAALRTQYGAKKIAVVQTDMGAVVVCRPNHVKFKQFQDLDEVKIDHIESLVRPCVKHPALDRFDVIAKEMPGVVTTCAQAVAHLAGVRKVDLGKK